MRVIPLLLVAVAVAAGCGGSDPVDTVGSVTQAQPTQAQPTQAQPTEPAVVPTAGAEGAAGEDDASVVPTEVAEGAAGEDDAVVVPTAEAEANDGIFPTVVAVTATNTGDQTWRFDVTLSSEYDSPQRYADAWRVLDADDNELGIRILMHDHANEQPFTRSTNVEVPAGVGTVYIEARDQLNGWNSERYEVGLTP